MSKKKEIAKRVAESLMKAVPDNGSPPICMRGVGEPKLPKKVLREDVRR